ncbi:MAG: SCP2 sterol-binding domain-containing protein [Bacillota bacterium]
MADAKVIPLEAIPDARSEVVNVGGRPYLLLNDAMFTFYRRSMGEFSPFFLALRDEKRILGARCTRCGLVRVPPFVTRCPDCGFAPTELVEVGDVGQLVATPPVTYFANSLFQQQVPFGRGRAILRGADTALSVNLYTTRGILVPGIFRKGTEVKVVFRSERKGEITDIFCVPTAELTPDQVAKKGLEESELDWERATEPPLPSATAQDAARFHEIAAQLSALARELSANERARRDIANWWRTILVKTTGGTLVMKIANGDLTVEEGTAAAPDLVMVVADPAVLLNALAYRGSLTQAIMTGKLWISKNVEFTTVFKLERMARSLARSKKA